MNSIKMTIFSCAIICIANLVACTPVQKKQNANNDGQNSLNLRQAAYKKWNESLYRFPTVQHRQEVQNLSQKFPGVVIYKGNSNLKRVALTFDDGPDNYYTPRILDILHAKKVPGTFFMVGKEAQRFPEMVKRIAKEGHSIGNHSWDHPKLWTLSNERIKQEILSTDNEIQQLTGRGTTLFRPPYGRVTPADVVLIHNMGYHIIDWSVDTLDWKGTPAPTIMQFVNKEVSPGAIILEHCFASHPGELNGTLQALPQIIDHLKAEGYEFVSVPTLIGT